MDNPPSCHRAAPFYSWNAVLENDELRRQIGIMHEMGFGGAFMHSRVGLGTPYLGTEWFERISACIDEAGKYNMFAWLYDEDRWPSGAAGGIVTKNREYRARSLCIEKPLDAESEPIALYAVIFENQDRKRIKSYRRVPDQTTQDELAADEVLTPVYLCLAPPNPWYNGQTYLDTKNPDAVDEFIRVTHEAYKRENSADFGGTVPGVFTDEPNASPLWLKSVSWTGRIPEIFQERHGYDLLDHLPELFWQNVDLEYSATRVFFHNIIADLFSNSFNRKIGEWCQANNLIYTGHMLGEDTMTSQIQQSGSVMRQYEYMQQPGIDLLTEHWNIFNTAKQCSSMAHQFGRARRLTETYGCTGWDFPFFGHKALSDWQFALGINMRVPHLAWYSMEGEAKRDYPASIFYQSPWYKNYRDIEDVLARTSVALEAGEEQRDLLVIQPVESYQGILSAVEPSEQYFQTYDKAFEALTNTLLENHLDFDLGEEEIMSRHAAVCGKKFMVAKASYKAVLIPESVTIRSSTLNLLQQFAEQGGIVCYLGKAPEYMDALVSSWPVAVYNKFFTAISRDNMVQELEKTVRRVSVADENGKEIKPVLYLLKKHECGQTLFVCNTGVEYSKYIQRNNPACRERTLEFPFAAITVTGQEKYVYELDVVHNKLYSVPCETAADGKKLIRTSFGFLESRLYFLTDDELAAEERSGQSAAAETVVLDQIRSFRLDDPNVFILDQFEYSIDRNEFQQGYILGIDDRVREYLGEDPRGAHMVQPWLARIQQNGDALKTAELCLKTTLICDELPHQVMLALEHPEIFTITLNGIPLDTAASDQPDHYWVDLCCRTLEIPDSAFVKGENTLEFRCRYHKNLSGLEAMFLLGDFSVKNNHISSPVTALEHGSIVSQGLPHYAGNLIYSYDLDQLPSGKKFRFCAGKWQGVSLSVRVDGGEWIAMPCYPFSAGLEALTEAGNHTLEVRVFGSRRNAFGPFYCQEALPAYCGPWYFKDFAHPERTLIPFGLLEAPRIEIEK